MAQTLGTLLVDIKGDTTQLIQGFNRAEKAVTKTTQTMGSAVKVLTGVFASLQAIDLAKGYAKQVDEIQNVNNRLGLVVKTNQELSAVQKSLYEQAQKNSASYTATADLYTRMANSTKNLKLSQEKLLNITDLVNKSMVISGTSTANQEILLEQLSQAFSSNFQSVGQEFNTMKDQAPRLFDAILQGTLETNKQFKEMVDRGEEATAVFKKWASDGKLSNKIIIDALASQGVALTSDFDKMVKTIEQSVVKAQNSLQKLISDFDKASGVSKSISSTISDIADSIDNLSPEKVEKLAENFKEGAIAVATAYGSIKLATTATNAYSFASEKVISWNKASIEIENAKTKAISLGEQATKARKLADEALNVSRQSGLIIAQNNYQMLNKEASKLEEAAKKQQALSYQIEATGKSFSIAAIASNAYKSALASIPFIAISVAIGAVATSLLSASRASQTLEGTLKSTGEELKKLTNNQLQYRKELLEQELIQTRLDMANAKARAAKSSATAEDKAERDEAVKNFEEQTQKLREIKQIQDELAKPTKVTNSISGTTSGDEKNKKKPLTDELQAIIDESVLIKKKYEERFAKLKELGQDTAENMKILREKEAEEIKSLSKDEIKEAKKSADEQKKILEDKQSQYYNYYEKIKDYDKLWILEEQKLREENKYLKQDEMNKLLEVEKQSFQKRYETEKEYLSADEWRDYFLKIKDYDNAWLIEQSELYVKYGDSLGENFARFAQIAKTEFYDKINEENSKLSDEFFKFKLEFDTNGLNDLGKSLYTISDITEELATEQKLYNEAISEARDKGKDTAKIEEQHTKNQLIGYSNIAGAMSTMYEEGSREAAAFQAIQTTLALIEATRAVVSQGSGDPYTAIPRMIAMAAMVSSLLGSVGIAFGMNKTSTSSDTFSSMAINEGKGTVIGDSDKVSESITKSLDILEDFAEPQYQTLLSMNKYLANISNAMGGVTTLLVRNAGFALGEGFTESETAWKNNITGGMQTAGGLALNAGLGAGLGLTSVLQSVLGAGALTSPIGGTIAGTLTGAGLSSAMAGALAGTGVGLVTMLVDKFILGGVINKAIGSVLGGLFGKTKVSQSLEDSGIYFADTLLGNAIESIDGALYQTIKTVTTKKSWFSSSSSTRLDTYFEDMDNELERQFSLVLRNLYMVSVEAGAGLDVASNELINKLNSFVVKFGKISLKGKNADEIQETLEGVFSQISDNIAQYLFPALTDFQKVGEGLFETMIRVSTGMEEAEFYISRLGSAFSDLNYLLINNKQGDVGFEALLQSITKVEEKLYPTNNNLLKMIENLDLTAEELYQVYVTLEELRDRLIFLRQEAQGLSTSMIYGAGSVSDLQKGLDSFFENFLSDSEKLVYETEQLIEEFNKLNIALPVSKEAFKDLLSSLDLTTESGQELYGRLIILSESFASVADKTAESIAKLESELSALGQNGLNELSLSFDGLFNAIKGLKEIATSFIDSFSSSSLGNTRDQIKEYNKLRKQFNSFFDASGNLNANVTEKEAKELYSKLSGLGTAIGKSQQELQKDLVSQFELDLSKLDLTDQILKVNIVDGLADLLGLSEDQKKELQKVASDGNITNKELNNIGTLTETQKQGILDFANKSNYFSTEETLSYLTEYSRMQLEMLKQQQAEETERLTSKTLNYGDYIGKQEQIDIAKRLGVSYEAAKPVVEKLQNLTISKDVVGDIKKIVGFNGEDFTDWNAWNQLVAFDQESKIDIQGIGNQIYAEGQSNKQARLRREWEQARANFYAIYNQAYNNTNVQRAEYDEVNYAMGTFRKAHKDWWTSYDEHTANAILNKYGLGFNTNEKRGENWNQVGYNQGIALRDQQYSEYVNAINYFNQLEYQRQINGYAVGATNIPYDQIAQIHQGEMIIPKTFSEGLRTGELSLSANTPNVNLGSLNLFEGIKETMQDIFKTFSDYPKKTHDLLDDVINGRSKMRVETI